MKKHSCISCLCAVYSALLIFVGVLPLPKPYAEIVYGIFVLLQLALFSLLLADQVWRTHLKRALIFIVIGLSISAFTRIFGKIVSVTGISTLQLGALISTLFGGAGIFRLIGDILWFKSFDGNKIVKLLPLVIQIVSFLGAILDVMLIEYLSTYEYGVFDVVRKLVLSILTAGFYIALCRYLLRS